MGRSSSSSSSSWTRLVVGRNNEESSCSSPVVSSDSRVRRRSIASCRRCSSTRLGVTLLFLLELLCWKGSPRTHSLGDVLAVTPSTAELWPWTRPRAAIRDEETRPQGRREAWQPQKTAAKRRALDSEASRTSLDPQKVVPLSTASTSASSPTYSLDPNNPTSLGYYDGLRLLASRAAGEPQMATNTSLQGAVGRLGYHIESTWTTMPQDISATVLDEDAVPQTDDYHHNPSFVKVGTVQADGTRSGHVYLGHLTAMAGFAFFTFTLDWAVASLLAVHHWNNQMSEVLPVLGSPEVRECRVRFTHEYLDTHRSPREASRLLVQDVLPRPSHQIAKPRPTALLGAIRSPITMNLATLAGIEGIPILSQGSTSTSLNNPDEFPLFGRLTPSVAGTARAAASYFRFLGVSHVGVFYVRDDWGDSYRNAFSNAVTELAAENGDDDENPIVIHSVASDSFCFQVACMEAAVQELASRDYRYFFAILGPPYLDAVMELAHQYGIAGPGRFWLLPEVFSDTTLQRKKFPQGSPLAQATHGLGRIHAGGSPKVKNSVEAHHFLRAWQTLNEPEFKEYFKKQEARLAKKKSLYKVDTYDFHHVPSLYSEGVYDAVIAIGLASCHLTRERGGTNFTSEELLEEIKRTTFHGASGHVELDPYTGSRKYESIVFSVSNVVVARDADPTTGTVTLDVKEIYSFPPMDDTPENTPREWRHIEGSDPFTYADGTFTPPPSLPPPDVHKYGIPPLVLVAGWILCGILLTCSVLCALWVAVARNVPVVRASQPLFLYLICGGTFVMGSSIVPLSAQPSFVSWNRLDEACMLSWWLYSLGYVLVFSALFAKTLRLNMILAGDGYRRVKVTARDVSMPLVGLMSLNLAILSAWSTVAPLRYVYREGSRTDRYGRTLDWYGQCHYSAESQVFAATLLSLNVAVSLIALVEAFKGRNIVSDFGESRYIFYVLASILEAVALGVPVGAVAWDSPSASFAVTCSLIFVTGLSTLTLLLAPKCLVAWRTPRGRRRPTSKRASSLLLGPLHAPRKKNRHNENDNDIADANWKSGTKRSTRNSESRTCLTENSRSSSANQGILETFLEEGGGLDSFLDSLEQGQFGKSNELVTGALLSTTPVDAFEADAAAAAVRVRTSLLSSLFVRGNRMPVTRHSISVFRRAEIQELYDSTVTTPLEDENRDAPTATTSREMCDSSTWTVPNAQTTTKPLFLQGGGHHHRARLRSDNSAIATVSIPRQGSEVQMCLSPFGMPTSSCRRHHRHSLALIPQDAVGEEPKKPPLPAIV